MAFMTTATQLSHCK